MEQKKTKPLQESTLEKICGIIAEKDNGLTGTKIHKILVECNIEDTTDKEVMLSKHQNLQNSLHKFQQNYKCSDNVFQFIIKSLEKNQSFLSGVNKALSYEGYVITDKLEVKTIEKASIIIPIEKVEHLKKQLEDRNAHSEIFKYCSKELISDNYFHAVLEAMKGLFKRIKDLSQLSTDGNKLIEECFSNNPILTINNFTTQSEKDEHTGFCNLLKGLCGMFRNPQSHETSVDWPIFEQDALEILGVISYCHRRLEHAKKVR